MRFWNIDRCIRVFKDLTKAFFGLKPRPESWSLGVRRMLRCWLKDGLYDVKALEKALIDHFGHNMRMFDNYFPRALGFKVAVTATNIGNASTFLFSNYNGVGTRNGDSGAFPPVVRFVQVTELSRLSTCAAAICRT